MPNILPANIANSGEVNKTLKFALLFMNARGAHHFFFDSVWKGEGRWRV